MDRNNSAPPKDVAITTGLVIIPNIHCIRYMEEANIFVEAFLTGYLEIPQEILLPDKLCAEAARQILRITSCWDQELLAPRKVV